MFCRLLFVLFPLFVLGYCIVWFFPLELRLLITPLLSSNLLFLISYIAETYCEDILHENILLIFLFKSQKVWKPIVRIVTLIEHLWFSYFNLIYCRYLYIGLSTLKDLYLSYLNLVETYVREYGHWKTQSVFLFKPPSLKSEVETDSADLWLPTLWN